MLKLLKYLKPYSWMLLGLFVLVYIQVSTNLQLPDYMAKIINQGIVGKDTAYILKTGGQMLLVSLAGALAMVGVGYLASRIATGFSMNIREKVFSKVESFSLSEFNTFSTASLITRSTNDIQQIQMVVIMILRMVIAAPLTGIWAIVKAYDTAPSMSWIMILAVTIMVGVIVVLFSAAIPKFKILQTLVDKLNLVTRENLTGLRVIKAFNSQKFEEAKFEKANQDLTDLNLFVNRLMAIMMPFMTLIFSLTSIGVIWFGAHYVDSGSLMIGDMLAFMQYAMQVIMAFLMVSIVFIMVPRAAVSGSRVSEVLETEPLILNPEKPVHAGEDGGRVDFEDVTFTYPGADSPVLENVTFSALPGETTAFIGSTGSGKTTLVNLIPRFFDVSSGSVKVDGVDVRDLELEELYSKIGYVPQKGVLFSGTVESNIKYGVPTAPGEQVEHAAVVAQADSFIRELDGQYDAPISQGGTNVSGGQKQRLSIARAIARKPEVYIFDDSFSALDFKTDAKLRHALEKETAGKTVLIVAQRISTIMHANKIVVLDDGKIVGTGTHGELMKSCQVYQEIAGSQLSEEELKGVAPKAAALAGRLA